MRNLKNGSLNLLMFDLAINLCHNCRLVDDLRKRASSLKLNVNCRAVGGYINVHFILLRNMFLTGETVCWEKIGRDSK